MTAGDVLAAVLLGLVEGLTEFIPVSSTGHLIVAARLLGRSGDAIDVTIVVIQLGAILAVCWHFRRRIIDMLRHLGSKSTQRFIVHIILAFIPAAAVGFFAHGAIKELLFTPLTVAAALVLGGVAILVIERLPLRERAAKMEAMTRREAIWVGIAQTLALIPGVSRSAATIMGGRLAGMSRQAATEFSFFLAIPVMFAATIFDMYENRELLGAGDLRFIAVSFVVSFASALFAVRWLLGYVARHDFRPFGWYRIVAGLLIAAWFTYSPQAI